MEEFWDSLYSLDLFLKFLLGGLVIAVIRYVIPFMQYKIAKKKAQEKVLQVMKGDEDILVSQKNMSEYLYSLHPLGNTYFLNKRNKKRYADTAKTLKDNKNNALLKILLQAKIHGCEVEIRRRNNPTESSEFFVSSKN
jgi:hypothetical protein